MAGNIAPVELRDANGNVVDLLNAPPGVDSGQRAVAVRVISQLGGFAPGGLVDVSDRVARVLGVVSGTGVFHVDDNGGLLSVDDGAGSLTVDAPVGTPVFVRLSDGGAGVDPALKAQLPAALVGGRLDVNLGAATLVGQKAMAASLPVVIASDQTVLKAREDTAAMTWASVKSAAPGIGAVQATTGALAAGDYDFDIQLLVSEPAVVGHGMVVEHRNAADAATLQTLGGCSAPGQIEIHLRRYTLALNERIRVIAGTAAGAAASMYVSAIGRRLS